MAKRASPTDSSDQTHTDVIIVGGGLAGLTLAALLGSLGARVACLDREPPESHLNAAYDGRTTAISYGSRKVLEAAGVWAALEKAGSGACPIRTIHILDGETSGRGVPLEFDSAEAGGRIFGWIVDNPDFRRCLFERVKALKTVRHVAPCAVTDFFVGADHVAVTTGNGVFRAPLVIGADGRNSFTRAWMGLGTRAWSYRQQAVVCCAVHDNPHGNVAVEHFRREGPFAILPMSDDAQGRHRSSVVWTNHADQGGNSPLHWNEDSFNAALTARFPAWYGQVRLHGKRAAFPLSLVHAHNYIGPRMALAAEAAHAIHPIAGQGLNMGFRDIASLAGLITAALKNGEDVGGDTLLQAYQRERRFDNMAMAGATDGLNRLFSNDLPAMALARHAGLKIVANWPRAKRFFMGQAMGAAGVLPDLIRDHAASSG
jgi:2-octaprenyl-6-methoxyphenol hydroxylase